MVKTEKEKEEQSLKILKTVVIGMGVVLVLGTFALLIAILQRSSQQTEPKTVVYNTAQAETPAKCVYKPAQIPVNAPIVHATTEGNILTIVTKTTKMPKSISKVQEGLSLSLSAEKGKTSQQVIVYDLCEGKVLTTVEVMGE